MKWVNFWKRGENHSGLLTIKSKCGRFVISEQIDTWPEHKTVYALSDNQNQTVTKFDTLADAKKAAK